MKYNCKNYVHTTHATLSTRIYLHRVPVRTRTTLTTRMLVHTTREHLDTQTGTHWTQHTNARKKIHTRARLFKHIRGYTRNAHKQRTPYAYIQYTTGRQNTRGAQSIMLAHIHKHADTPRARNDHITCSHTNTTCIYKIQHNTRR